MAKIGAQSDGSDAKHPDSAQSMAAAEAHEAARPVGEDSGADGSSAEINAADAARMSGLAAEPLDPSSASSEKKSGKARLLPIAEQIWAAAKVIAAGIIVVWLIGWPFGTSLALMDNTGLLRIGFGYTGAVFLLALTNAAMVLVGGYLLRASLRLEATAKRLGAAVESIEPQARADSLKDDVAVLDSEIDRALGKLANAEHQIRAQVGAIDAAAESMQDGSGAVAERLAAERRALIDATAAMNAEAEAFAAALADKSRQNDQRADDVAADLNEKVDRLEKVSSESAEQFEALKQAMADNLSLLQEKPAAMASQLEDGAASLREAQQALIAESEKLQSLIDQQRRRADHLGKTLAEQQERLSQRRDVTQALGQSWRRILQKVERNPADGNNHVAPLTDDERLRLERLQRFTLTMRQQLFGPPEEADVQRFEEGDRQLFLKDIIRRDPEEIDARLKLALSSDPPFAEKAKTFLDDFDQLLAPVIDAEQETADAALDDMLRSPLGQIYVMTGTARGHFKG